MNAAFPAIIIWLFATSLKRFFPETYDYPAKQLNFVPMKFAFTIIGVYLLILSCLPCGDGQDANNSNASATVSLSTDDEQHQHSNEICTPFCVCACCAVSSFFNSTTKVVTYKYSFLPEKNAIYEAHLHTRAQHAIWQPPRIS